MILFTVISRFLNALGYSNAKVLYSYAKSQLGNSFYKKAPKAYACAETINTVFRNCFGNEVGGDVSTLRMYQSLKSDKRFKAVTVPLEGDIIISYTGSGMNPSDVGHVGIVSDHQKIMSNNSSDGLFDEHLDMEIWYKRYQKGFGMPVYYFRVLL